MESMEEQSDVELVSGTLHGKPVCFEHLVTRYSARLFRFVYVRLRSQPDAEDICQETFLKAFRSLHTFDVRNSFKTWLFSIAFHETVSFLRKKKVPTRSTLPEIPSQADKEEASAEQLEVIWEAARCLAPDQYSLLWLKYKEDLPIHELAAITGKNRMHICVLLHRARRKLADMLRPCPVVSTQKRSCKVPSEISCSIQGESNVL